MEKENEKQTLIPTITDREIFDLHAQRWNCSIEADERDLAFFLAENNPELKKELIRETFGDNPSEVVTLYRVGNLGDMIVSLFSTLEAAEAYQRRFGVDRINSFEVPIEAVVPSGACSGEVWVMIDDLL